MSRPRIAPALFLLALCASCSGASRPGDVPTSADPVIATPAIEVLLTGLPFQLQLEAIIASPPATWAFDPAPPSTLSWLSLSAAGLLAGTPPAVLIPAERVTVRVTDAASRTATATLAVEVHGCDPATTPTRSCFASSGSACTQGVAVCAAGVFGACLGGASTDAGHCGSECAPCGAGADRCYGGDACRCGSGAACTGANTTSFSCSAGACVNACAPSHGDCDGEPRNGCEAALTTLANCGACGVACTAPAGGTVQCVDGRCVPSCPGDTVLFGGACVCSPNLTPCGPEPRCVSLQRDRNNCGACGNVCAPVANGTSYCGLGTCLLDCRPTYVPCNGTSCVPTSTCGGGLE